MQSRRTPSGGERRPLPRGVRRTCTPVCHGADRRLVLMPQNMVRRIRHCCTGAITGDEVVPALEAFDPEPKIGHINRANPSFSRRPYQAVKLIRVSKRLAENTNGPRIPKDSGPVLSLVRKRGFEPLRYCYRQPLKLVRLPVPPLPRTEGRMRFAGHLGWCVCKNSHVPDRPS